MALDFFMEHFDSTEAEAITGVSQMLQRSYRKRGYLPPQPGHSRHDLFDLADMQFTRAMAARGVEILLAKRFAGRVAQGITFYALSHSDAYAGPVGVDYDLAPQALAVLQRHAPMGSDCAIVVPVPFWVLWADDTATWMPRLDGDLFERERAQKTAGPVIIFDQQAAGEALRQRAGRPLVRVSGLPHLGPSPGPTGTGLPDVASHQNAGAA